MIFDWQVADRMDCSRKEKEQLVQLIDLFIQASEKARLEGLLALEDDIEEYEYPLLRTGMQLVVDGTDPELIKEILSARILSENKRGKAFLEQVLIYTGLLSIQAGDNPRVLMERLFAFLGEEAEKLRSDYIANVVTGRENDMVDEFKQTDGVLSQDCAALQKLLPYDNRAIQKILREIDFIELSTIMLGADSILRQKIIQNMSRRAAVIMVETSQRMIHQLDEVRASIAMLFEISGKLADHGEIVLPA